jgi:hypothetical protein
LEAALAEMARDRSWSVRSESEQQGILVYEPVVIGLAEVRFVHSKSRQTHAEDMAYLVQVGEGHGVNWAEGQVRLEARDLANRAERDAFFADLPSDLGASTRHTALRKEFEDHLYYNSSITLLYNPHVDLYSEPGESETSFQRRCRKAAEDAHDEEAKKLKDKYEKLLDRIEDKLQREERELEQDKIEHDARKQEEVLSGVDSLIGLFTGRRSSSRLSTASRKRRMTRQARADIEESEEVIEELEDQIDELEEEAKLELEELAVKWGELIEEVEKIEVRPRRADVRLELFALGWLPCWEVPVGDQVVSLTAFEVEPA